MSQKEIYQNVSPEIIKHLNLSEKETKFFMSYWEQIFHLKKISTRAAFIERILAIATMVGSLFIPVLIILSTNEAVLRIMTIIASLAIAVALVVEKTFSLRERSLFAREHALKLENEANLYLTKAGPYAELKEGDFRLFVERFTELEEDVELSQFGKILK